MAGTLSFFKQIGISKLGGIGDSMVAWYAEHDPETASAADIADLGTRAEQLAHRIAEIQGKLEHDQHNVEGLTLTLDRDKRAAVVLGHRLKAAQEAGNTTLVTQITSQITPVLAQIEQIAGEDGTGATAGQLFEANATLATDNDDLAQFREAHTRAINDWTSAKGRLDHARNDMEHAAQQQRDAQDRAKQAERDAGLLGGSRPGHTALDAMDKRAAEMRVNANAATIQANALRHVGGGDVADVVTAALAEAQPDKSSAALDRLARLTGGG
jgi:chromosome segregation ATPase